MKREDIHKVSALSQADGYALAQASDQITKDAALDEFDARDDAVMRQNENWMLERFAIDESRRDINLMQRPDPVDVTQPTWYARPLPPGWALMAYLLAWLAFLGAVAYWRGWL